MFFVMVVFMSMATVNSAVAGAALPQDKEKCKKECCSKCDDKCKQDCKNGNCKHPECAKKCEDKKSCCKKEAKA